MIQDIYPHKLNNHYHPHVQIEQEDIVLCIVDGKILVQEKRWEENELVFPRMKDITGKKEADYRYLFAIDTVRYFLLACALGV